MNKCQEEGLEGYYCIDTNNEGFEIKTGDKKFLLITIGKCNDSDEYVNDFERDKI